MAFILLNAVLGVYFLFCTYLAYSSEETVAAYERYFAAIDNSLNEHRRYWLAAAVCGLLATTYLWLALI